MCGGPPTGLVLVSEHSRELLVPSMSSSSAHPYTSGASAEPVTSSTSASSTTDSAASGVLVPADGRCSQPAAKKRSFPLLPEAVVEMCRLFDEYTAPPIVSCPLAEPASTGSIIQILAKQFGVCPNTVRTKLQQNNCISPRRKRKKVWTQVSTAH